MANNSATIKFSAQFDVSQITKGFNDIKKQMSNTHIGEDLRKQLETALSKVEANIPALEKMSAKGEYNTKDLEAFQKIILQVSKDMQALDKLAAEADFTKSFSAADTEKIKQFEKQLTEVENKLKNTRKEIIDNFSKSDQGKIGGKSNATLNGFIEQLISVPPDQIESKLDEIIKETEQQANNAVEKLQQDFQTKVGHKTGREGFIELIFGKDSGVSLKDNKTLGFSKVTGDQGAYSVYNKIRDDILALKQDASAEDINKILERYQAFVEEYFDVPEGKQSILANIITPEIVENLKQFTGEEGIAKLKALLGEEKLKILADGEVEKLKLTQEQAAFLKQRLDELVQSKKLTADQAKIVEEALGGMNNKIQEGSEQIRKEKTQADALSATFGSLANRITNSISALTVFNKSIQIIHKAIDSVKELDAAFTQIAIVSEQSNEQAWQMFDSFNKLAKQYSITTKDLTEGAKLFYQQGLNAADTMKMVEASTISAALGEVTMTEAANTLTAAIQGYNESAAVAMDYTDKIAMVGAVSAADFNELSSAMEKTASSAYTAGIDFDHLLGYLGKMIEVTREAPANLGTAMKTIIARFEDMKKDPNALIDGASANKVEAALATIGIALRDTAGEFRPLQDVFDELGVKWNTLSRNQQAYIATVAAGSRQQSRFLALMNNYDRTLDLITESENSAGAALRQYATYQDSAAAATARLTAAWEEFYTKIVNSEQIIWVIDRLKDLVEVMTKIGPIPSAIGASLAALGGQTILKSVIPNLSKNLATAATTGKALSFSLSGIKAGAIAVGTSFLEVIGIIAAVVLVIYGAIKAWQALDKALHPVREDAKRLTKEINSLNEKIDESSKKSNSLEKLMDRYDELYNKIYRTKEEQEELNQVINDIDKNSDRAVVSIDESGNAHLQNANSIKEEIQAEKDYIKMNAELVYAKKKELLTNNEVTEDQARSVGLNKYGDLIAFEDDTTVQDYKKYRDAINNRFNDTLNSNKILNELYTNYSNASSKINMDIFGENFVSYQEAIIALQDKIFKEQVKKAEEEGKELDLENISKEQQKAVDEYAFLLLHKVYGDLDNLVDNYSNENYKEQLKNEAKNEALVDYYNQMTEADEKYSVLADLFQKSGLMADDFQELIGNEDDFLKEYGKDIQKYLDSDKTTDDVQALVDVLSNSKKDIADALQDWINEAIKQSFTTDEQKAQFIKDNKTLLSDMNIRQQILDGSITNDEMAKMQDIANSSDFSKLDKFSLFSVFAENDTKLNDLINDYVKKINNGLYSEADQIKQTMIELLSSKGISGPAAERMAQFFIEDYEGYVNNRLSQAEEFYKSAKDIYKKAPQEALTDKEYEFVASQDKNVDRYININEQGERYLSILGKINLLENTRVEYINAVNEKMQKNVDDMTRYEAEILKANKELDTSTDLNEKQIDSRKSLIKTNEQLIINLKQQNDLYAEQLKAQEDINNAAAAMVLGENLSRADSAAKNIEKIGQAFGEAQQNAGALSFATAQGLLAMDDSYQQYIKIVNGMVTLSAEGAEAMTANETKKYNDWLKLQKDQLRVEQILLRAQLADIKEYLAMADGADKQAKKEQLKTRQEEINAELAKRKEGDDKTAIQNQSMLKGLQDQYSKFYDHLFQADKEWKKQLSSLTSDTSDTYLQNVQTILSQGLPTVTVPEQTIEIADLDFSLEDDAFDEALQEEAAQIEKRLNIIDVTLEELDSLSANFGESFKKGVASAIKGGGKDAEKSLKALEKIFEDMTKALEDLDKLIKEVNYDLNAIRPDYNPFTELFEAWEHEWDYYYNIKRLIAELGQQGQFIDNIISADFVSADQKVSGYHAKIGNLIAQMAANDTYITSLRTGMSQTALELMKNYGEYYKINPDTGQIYQTDKNLNEINTTINAAKEELYNLSKVQNTRQNDLNLENSKLEALEKEKSAYESILSEVESQIDSYKNLDDIIVDTSELEANRSAIKAKIEISDESIEAQKEKIREMEDEIQNFEIEIELKGNVESKLEEYVDKMEEKVQEYEEYWDTLNSTIEQQQEILSQLNDVFKYYIDTAISTEQEIYNAIVENYQDEINKKKQQYDYLKQLDKDYLASVRENINRERQAREDANKQKNYQQSLQRMQLLQQDTSGAYRNELAQLGKEIEGQRQDLYDDLVDKQVDALEKEIDKRHELYDKEVAALEERLAYMQENAILLWEMVNNIVAEGSENMMATLENTTAYINSNELSRQKQRKQWEQNIEITYDGVVNNQIDNINTMVEKGKDYVGSLQEIRSAIETNIETYQASTEILIENNSEFQNVMDNFMSEWNRITYRFTGYYESWEQTVEILKLALDNNIQALINMNNEGGSIRELDKSLRNAARDMYNDFIAERQRYRNELEGLIQQIRSELGNAVHSAAGAIQSAAASAQVVPNKNNGNTGATSGSVQSGTQSGGVGSATSSSTVVNRNKEFYREEYAPLDANYHNHIIFYTIGPTETKKEPHEWEYISSTQRRCKKCGYEEIQLIKKPKGGASSSSQTMMQYDSGGIADYSGMAWLDGSPSNPERILSPRQTKLFESMVHSLEKSTNSNINSGLGSSYNIGDINTTIQVDRLDNETDVNKLVKQVEDKILKTIRNRVVVSV